MLSGYQDKLKCITGDETWIHAYDPERTDKSSDYRAKAEARPKRARQSHSKIKVMMTVFFDFRVVVHYEFFPPRQTVKKEYYLSTMSCLWTNNSWFLHHYNAPSHTALVLPDHFVKNSTHIVPQPAYSPDLAPCDFWLFPKLKEPLRRTSFESIDEIKAESNKALMAIPEKDYLTCFEDWKIRWYKCISSRGDHFKGDKIDLQE